MKDKKEKIIPLDKIPNMYDIRNSMILGIIRSWEKSGLINVEYKKEKIIITLKGK